MNLATLIAVIGAVTAVESAVIGTLAWMGGRRSERKRADDELAAKAAAAQKQAIEGALQPVAAQIAAVASKVEDIASVQRDVTQRLREQERSVTETRAQLQVFMTVMARQAADILHSPVPERHHIDRLLEAFKDGTLDEAGRAELRSILEYIVNLEHGQEPDFPVFPGDQVSAAFLLAYMDSQGDVSELRTSR